MKNNNKLLSALLICLFAVSNMQLQAQNNSLVLGGAYIVLSGGTAANNISLVVDQPNPLGIFRLPAGGHIVSENQYNYVKWLTAASTGNYLFPFGVGGNATDYIPFTFNKTTSGVSNVSASTWTTDQQNNPKPAASNVGAVTNMFGTADSVLYAIDRFWNIQTSAATTADLTFSYLGSENTTSSPTNLVMAQHWNGTTWDAQVGPGTAGVTTGVGTAGVFLNQNTFSPWVLTVICTADNITQNPVICQGNSVTVGTNVYTITGTYIDTLTNVLGCDSIVTTNLTVNPITSGTDVQTACNTLTWIDGITYSASTTTPTFTIVGGAASGCDSVVTLNLTINNTVTSTDIQTACNTLTWIDGITYTASTTTPTFTIVGGAANGCDSVVTLNLTINNTVTSTDIQTACNSLTWIDGITYNTSTNTPTYTYVGGSYLGCDSVVTLNLTINNTVTSTDIQTACNTYTWIDGITYTASTTTPTFTIVGGAASGCDSVVTLNLTINTFASGTDTQTACNSLTWIDGINYTASTNTPTYTYVGGSYLGCDSVVTLNLTITPTSNATINPDGPFCTTTTALNLTAADAGGVWSGTGITNTTNGTFDPGVAGAGTHQIIYTISGTCGDADTVDIVVNVCPLPPTGCCNFAQNANNNGVTSETFGVKLGDLDGDGDLDAVTIDAYDAIEVWFNNGSGIFAAGTTYSTGSDFYGVELEDVDSDGDLDIIAISFYAAQATEIWKNNGTGAFSLFQSISNNIGSENSRLADLDGDGDLDIFHTNWMGNEQKIYLNNGSGNFSYLNSVTTTGAKSDVALADFDGDGDIDALLSDANGLNNELWLNNGSGTFIFSIGGFATNSSHAGTAAADFDGDGDNDFVVIGGASYAPAEVYLNNGNATFGSAIILAHLGSNYDKDVVTIDYDNDGDMDIIISTYGSNGVEVWNNDGTANFSLCYKNPSDVYAHGFDAGDVDGDGLIDLYLGNFSGSDGDRVFIQTPPVTVIANATTTTICSGDAVTLTGSGSGATGYTWNNGVTDGVAFNPTVTTTYTVTGTNGSGCDATDTITIIVNSCTPPACCTPTNTWAKNMGSIGNDQGNSIALDATGNSYTTGFFSGTVDFDPGAGIFNLTSTGGDDIFLSKLDAAGNFVWAKSIGGMGIDKGRAITIDAIGNIYTTGFFSGTVDFDPGAGISNLTSTGSVDIFISKLDATGNFVWAKNMGGVGDNSGKSIVVDNSGNVYTSGYFTWTADFDPGVGVFNLTSTGGWDIFVSKLDATGNFVWAKTYGQTTSNETSTSIALDGSNNVYTTGYFNGTTDFDPGIGTFNLTSNGFQDIFVSKLDAAGNFVWAKNMGSTSNDDNGNSIAIDGNGNVITTGFFTGVADFDPGIGTFNLTSVASYDIFVSKLDAAGNFVWAKSIGGINIQVGTSITFDGNNNVYTTGYFNGTADFDPSIGTFNLTSNGVSDIFVSKLDVVGDFVCAYQIGSSGNDEGISIAVGGSGYVYTTGYFNGTPDFDPSAGLFNLTSNGANDVFVSKVEMCATTTTLIASFTTSATTICAEDSITFTDNSTGAGITSWNWTFNGGTPVTANTQGPHTISFNTAGTYNITLQVSNGVDTDDTTIVVTVNPTSSSTDTQTACDSLTWIDGITYTASTNTPTFTLTNAIGCDSVVTLNLIINNTTTSTDVQTVCDSLTWIDGITYTASTNTPTFTLTNAIGCDSVVTLNLTINSSTSSTDVQTACDSLTWIDGITYTASTTTPTFTLTNSSGCDSVVTLNLTINSSTSSTDVQTACDSLTWIDGITYTTSTNTPTFTIVGGSVAGCDSVVTLNLTINTCTPPTTNFTISDTLICEIECINYTNLSTGETGWNWTFIGGTPSTSTTPSPTVCYNIAGTYPVKLIVSNAYGSDTLTKTIVVVPTPTVTASADVTINLGEITTLTATGSGGTYTWSPSDWLSCVSCQTTIASPEETTTYTVTADSNGCKASDKVTVKVDFVNIIFVPNIFSPNGDGVNDIVYVEGKTIDKVHFFIYDRWGEQVFETTKVDEGWDGTFRGEKMNKAVFVYYVEATFKDGTKATKKGDITLMK